MKFIYQLIFIFAIIDVLVIFVAFQLSEFVTTIAVILTYNWNWVYFPKKTRLILKNGVDPVPYFYLFAAMASLFMGVVYSLVLKYDFKNCVFKLHSKNWTATEFGNCGVGFEQELYGTVFFLLMPLVLTFFASHFFNKSSKKRSTDN